MCTSVTCGTVLRVNSHLRKRTLRWYVSEHCDREPVNMSNTEIQVGRQTSDNIIKKMVKEINKD